MDSLLIVHVGAGSHNINNNDRYKKLIRKSLSVPTESVLSCAVEAATVLEISTLTNTGLGSSLDLSGAVSCDASFVQLDRNGYYKYYGSAVNVATTTPVATMVKTFEKIESLYSTEKFSRLGLSKPRMVDFGNRKTMCDILGVEEEPLSLVSEKQGQLYRYYRDDFDPAPEEKVSDTIGVMHVGANSTVITSSSGGNFLKLPGRIGCAGVIGAGIGYSKRNSIEISCMCSGNGDDIIMMSLASSLVSEIHQLANIDDLVSNIHRLVTGISRPVPLSSRNQVGDAILYVGTLVCIRSEHYTRLIYYHTTETFYFGFNNHGQKKVVLSRLDDPKTVGKSFVVGEYIL